MTLQRQPARGGFKRRPGLENWKRPGIFIAKYLSQNGQAEGHEIYTAYKADVRSEPSPEYYTRAKRSLRKTIVRERQTKPHQRIKVTKEEIESRMPSWLADHPFKSSRRCCSYNSFMHYIWIAKQLGLIEDTGELNTAQGKSGSEALGWHESHPSSTLRLTGSADDTAWLNLWQAYQAQG
jgi:hypothetical protein